MPARTPQISIIILTKNGASYLDEILRGIFSQEILLPYEIIAIDSGSQDSTLEIINRFPVHLHCIPPNEFNHGATRNLGVYLAQGQYLVFITQDAIPADQYWLSSLIAPLQKMPDIVAVCSRQIPRGTCNPLVAGHLETSYPLSAVNEEIKHFPLGIRNERIPRHSVTLSNVSAAYRKTSLVRFPFPTTDFAEDAAWEYHALLRGEATMFQPRSVVIHSHTYGLTTWLRRCYLHAWAMQQIFSSADTTRQSPSYRHTKSIGATIRNDWRNLENKNIRGIQRMCWLGYGVFWHGTAMLGAMLGGRAEKNPAFLHHFLSQGQHLWKTEKN